MIKKNGDFPSKIGEQTTGNEVVALIVYAVRSVTV
jgi:hypothetical protein